MLMTPGQIRVLERNAARKAAGIAQTYPQHRANGKPTRAAPAILPCVHRGDPTGETVECQSCRGTVSLKLFACAVHGTCTLGKRVDGHGCCDAKCAERVTAPAQ